MYVGKFSHSTQGTETVPDVRPTGMNFSLYKKSFRPWPVKESLHIVTPDLNMVKPVLQQLINFKPY